MSDLTRATQVTPEIHEEITKMFAYAAWDERQKENSDRIRMALCEAFEAIIEYVPPSPIRTRALNDIVDARLHANEAITFKGDR